MKPLKIKFHYSRLELILNALQNYQELMESLSLTSGIKVDDWIIRKSIAVELFFRFQSKQQKRFPSEKQKMNLELHEAIVLQHALLKAQPLAIEAYSENAIEQMKNDLNQNLIAII